MTTTKSKTTKSKLSKTSNSDKNLEVRVNKLEAQLARAIADYDNLQKRFDRDSAHVIKFANSNLISKLLNLRDNLDLTEQSLNNQGVSMLLAELDKILKEEGVVKINTHGEFDPTCMECSEVVPGEKDKIISTVRVGYKLHDRILRHARVTLGNGKKSKT